MLMGSWKLRLLLSFGLATYLWTVAGSSSAEDVVIHYRNEDAVQDSTRLVVCVVGDTSGCVYHEEGCAAGETCSSTVTLPNGPHAVYLHTTNAAGVESGPSNWALRNIVMCRPDDLACRADIDGNGVITATDFGRLLTVMGATVD